MDRSDDMEADALGLSCVRCHGRFEGDSGAVTHECPWCAEPLVVSGEGRWVPRSTYHADPRLLERRILHVIAGRDGSGRLLESVSSVGSIRPVYVPMRRLTGEVQSGPTKPGDLPFRTRYEVDVCLAIGLPDALMRQLEESPWVGSLPEGVPAGDLRVAGCHDGDALSRATKRLNDTLTATGAASANIARAQPGRYVDYYRPVWLYGAIFRSESLALAVDPLSSAVLYEAWQPLLLTKNLGQAKRVQLYALLFSAAAAIAASTSRWIDWDDSKLPVIVVLFVLCVLWFFALQYDSRGKLKRHALAGDVLRFDDAKRRWNTRRRIGIFLLLALGMMAASGLLVRTFGSITRFDPIPFLTQEERGIDAELIRPWSSVSINMLQSPMAVNGKAYVVTDVAPKLSPSPSVPIGDDFPRSGRMLTVGVDGYRTLADAIGASRVGDVIRVRAGRHDGGYAIVGHDLEIVGDPDAVVEWHGGRGPYLEIGGADTRLQIRHLRLEAFEVNSGVIGDPNVAYGKPNAGFRPHLLLEDVILHNTGGGGVNFSAPGASVEVRGGALNSVSISNGSRVVIGRQNAGLPRKATLFERNSGTGPGIARGVCVICLHDVDEAVLDAVDSFPQGSEVLVAHSAGRIFVGPHFGQLLIRLTDVEGRDRGVLPMPKGFGFEFRVTNGVAEF